MAILAGAIAVTLCSGIAAAGPNSTSLILEATRSLGSPGVTAAVFAEKLSLAPHKDKARYTVVLNEAPLATYAGTTSGFSAVPRDHKGHLQVRSGEAASYVSHLRDKQAQFVSQVETQLGRPLTPLMQFQHALNGVVLELTAAEAEALAKRPDVMMVDIEKMQPLLTDRGPSFIGADKIWDGTATGGVKSEGEGVVIGDIDSGINFTSPSFAGVGPIDGYHHVNPLGAGVYLGQCAPAGVDVGNCNDKLIGLYDFVNSVCTAPGNPCGAPGAWTEEPSATDSNGHGSHTASTTAGNHANVSLSGGNFTISGVAPHASVVAYDACYTRVSDGGGLCPTTSTTAAANQAVADGLVDIITFSIGGGTSPWTDSTSLAFLGAQNAGIFVVAAAGNDGPGAGTVSHVEPWVATAAASSHDRVLGYTFSLNSPGNPPPANTVNLAVRPGGNPQPTGDVVNLPIKQSPGFANGNNDGCTPFADPHTFDRDVTADERIFADGFEGTTPPAIIQKGIAVLHLDGSNSGCGSGARRVNALAAGAAAVIYVDIGYLNLGASDTSYSMTMPQWTAISAQINTDPTHAKASIVLPLKSFLSGQGDVVADFSSRGPAAGIGGQAIVKPEIAAPGVAILAAYMGAPGSVAIEDGTSMATPHIAGAAALLRSLHPTWTPTQIRSAMMLTAKATMTKQDGNPAGIWERGSGRIDLVAAAKAGLILDETGANYLAANPSTGGKISTLNLPSMAESSCVGPCTFTRTVRSARTGAVTYNLSINGLPAGSASVAPTSFTISTSGSKTFTVTVQGDMLPSGVYQLGDLTLTPTDPNVPTQHFPIAVQPGGPAIQVSANSVSGTSSFGGPTVQQPLVIKNIGNPTLNWAVGTTASPVTLLNTATTGNGEGYGAYSVPGNNYYGGQNFDVVGSVNMTTLRANGFLFPAATMSATNTSQVTFSIYGDAPGVPNGAPENVGAAPVWTYSGPVGGAGISITGANLALNLAAPGVPPLNLTTGRYWFVPYPTMTTTGDFELTSGWAWRTSSAAQIGNPTKQIHPADASPAWNDVQDGSKIMSAIIQGNIDCTQPSWVSYAPTSGALGYNATSNMTVTFDPTGLFAGNYGGTLCITSNATNTPTAIVGVNFTVTGTAPTAPTLNESFSPNSVATGANSTLTITLNNANSLPAKLLSNFTDTFPANLTASSPVTTCAGGTGVSLGAGNGSVILGKDAVIPANGSCTVTASVASSVAATYNNTIPAGALQTNAGNAAAASASLTVVGISAPGAAKSFTPASVGVNVSSLLTITLSNANGSAATLSSNLVDTFPAGLTLSSTPAAATTCSGGSGVSTTSGSITLGQNAVIPANGSCTVTVNVKSAASGSYLNQIAIGGLATNFGGNVTAASATLAVTADPFLLFSNISTDNNADLLNGAPTNVSGTRITPMLCNKLTLEQPGAQQITAFSTWLTNHNATATTSTALDIVLFYDDSGVNGGPGTVLGNANGRYAGYAFGAAIPAAGKTKLSASPLGYTATVVPAPTGGGNAKVWACLYYETTAAAVTDTILSNLGQEKFANAPIAGSTTDDVFITSSGADWGNNPPGTITSGAGNVLGWELTTLGKTTLFDSRQLRNPTTNDATTAGLIGNPGSGASASFTGYAATLTAASGSNDWTATGVILYPQCTAATAYADVQVTLKFWDTFNGSAASPVFTQAVPVATQTIDIGALTCPSASSVFTVPLRLPTPMRIGHNASYGITIEYATDSGSGLGVNGALKSVLTASTAAAGPAVGANASTGATGYYLSSSADLAGLNFVSTDYVNTALRHVGLRVYGQETSPTPSAASVGSGLTKNRPAPTQTIEEAQQANLIQ